MTEIDLSTNGDGLAPRFRGAMDDIALTAEYRPSVLAFFARCANAIGFTARRFESWGCETAPEGPELGRVLMCDVNGTSRTTVLEVDSTLVCLTIEQGRVAAWLASQREPQLAVVLAKLKEALPPTRPHDRQRIAFDFTWLTGHGCRTMTRVLGVPTWEEVASNYPAATRRQLQRLMRKFKPGRSGQTVVWHGEPGTGKTSALRALAWEWRSWCDVTVVLDPDQLFGGETGYLLDVIGEAQSAKHRLIVLEDAGELLRRDARRAVGQGLSRFLNACDGLLGQDQRLMMLVTTNEPIKVLHPAVSRAGRCAAEIEFRAFDRRAANRWLASRTDRRASAAATLAELYALAEGRQPTDARPKWTTTIGFGAGLAER